MIDPLDLHALADGELEKPEATRLREALKSDQAAKSEYESILNFRDLLKDKPLKYQSEECWRSCVKRLNEIDRTKKVETFVGRYSWAMCAVVFALILGGRFFVKDVRGDSARMADLGRVFPSRGSIPSQAVSAQQQQYKSILDQVGRVLDSKTLQPVGRSIGTFQGIPSVRADFRDGEGLVTLFAIDGLVSFDDAVEDPTQPGTYTDLIPISGTPYSSNCVIWHRGETTFVLAGDRAAQDLENIAGRFEGR